VEEPVADIDEGILVDVGVSNPVGSHVVVVQGDIVVVGLVLRHDLDLWIQLTADEQLTLGQHGGSRSPPVKAKR